MVAILFVGSLGAQDLKNLKINQLSDQQMMQVWQQFSAKGMTESEAMKMMVKKGLGPNEVGMFKKRLVGIQAAQKSKFGTSAATKNFIKDTSMFLQDSSWVNEVPFIRTNDKYYGYSFFSNPNTKVCSDQGSFANWLYGNMPSAKEGNAFALLQDNQRYNLY